MRVLSYAVLFVNALALLVIAGQRPDPVFIGVCMVALACCAALALMNGPKPFVISAVVACVLTAFAGRSIAIERYWFDDPAAFTIGVITALPVVALVVFGWSRTTRVWPNEMLVLNNPIFGGLRGVPGLDRVLLHPLASPLARLPRNVQEFHLDLERVNALPRDGPYGLVAQDIKRLRVELCYKLRLDGYRKIFALPNQGDLFNTAATAIGRRMPSAMRERAFWSHVWRLVVAQIAEPIIREEVHRSGLSPLEVSRQRDVIAEAICSRIASEITAIGLELVSCRIEQVEPDETEGSLRSREAQLLAQGRAIELELVGERLATLIRRVAEVQRASQGAISDEVLEMLIMSTLPSHAAPNHLRVAVRPPTTTGYDDAHTLHERSVGGH